MKALFLNAEELRVLKEYLAQSDVESCRIIMQKVEKAEKQETKYQDVISHVYKEAHQEIISFFRKNKIEHLDFLKCLYITRESQLMSLHIENYGIYAKCMDGESYDISYSDKLPFITEYLRDLKKGNCNADDTLIELPVMNKYLGKSLEELEQLTYEYLRLHWDNAGSSESDMSINDISRAKIEAYYQKNGNCFLGKINMYDCDRKNPVVEFVPYKGQLVRNFQYAYAIPQENEELRSLIKFHNKESKARSPKAAKDVVDKIIERISALGGIFLSWS